MGDLITSGMFTGMLSEIKACIPIVLPAVIGFLALRKGWSFVMSAVRGA